MKVFTGVSIRGPGHIKNKLPNQDSLFLRRNKRFTLAVVADGLGSKKHSDFGSKAICKAAYKSTKKYFSKKDEQFTVRNFLEDIVQNNWNKKVRKYGANECSTTCLILIATKEKIFVACLGDGMICLLGKDSADDFVFSESKNESFSNITVSVSNKNYLENFRTKIFSKEKFCGAVVCTDGISSDLDNSEIKFSWDLFKELCTAPKFKRKTLLKNMIKNWPVPHHTDDKTLVAMEFAQ